MIEGLDLLLIPIVGGLAALFCIVFLYRLISKESPGSSKVKIIAGYIQEGAQAFLKREIRTIAYFIAAIAIALYFALGWKMMSGFVLGAVLSVIAMVVGMNAAVRANVRTVNAANKSSGRALKMAFRGGGVMGLATVSINLLGLILLYIFFGISPSNSEDLSLLVGFGFGASLAALFAQLGGGIYTKAADVGADLVGKIETNIPEDDPRNPAVVADLVGDNVGDCAGRGADLFESSADNLIAMMILGLVFVASPFDLGWKIVLLPLIVWGIGNLVSIIGIFSLRSWGKNTLNSINITLLITGAISILAFYLLSIYLMNDIRFFYCLTLGLIFSIIVYLLVQYFTGINSKPVKNMAASAESGAAINLMTGLSYGMMSAAIPIIFLGVVITITYFIFGGGLLGVYGIATAALGLMTMTGVIMSSDAFGPIVDNASGIAQMSGVKEEVDKSLDELDSVGNVTKAITKGFSMTAALMTSVVLLFAYISEGYRLQTGFLPTTIGEVAQFLDLANPIIIVGLMVGATIPFLFSSMSILAVGRTANKMVAEVRRQFKQHPEIMTGDVKPDYAKCVDVSTKNSLREMIAPTLLGLIAPIIIGFTLGIWTLAAFLLSATIMGALLATFMFNTGGALDNTKKYVESRKGGKGTPTHQAAVTGDTFGDPLKDTAGPALHILIKLLNIVALSILPILVALNV